MTDLQIDPAAATAGTRSGENAPASGRRDWQRVSLFLGGIMFAVGNMLHPLEHKDAAYESATWEAAHLTIFFSLPLLVLGLPYLQRRLAARTDSRLAVFVRTVPKASAILGIGLNALSLLSCLLLFRYFGLLVDAASIFIILSAVMGSFFSVLLIDNQTRGTAGSEGGPGVQAPSVALALRKLFRRNSK